MTSSSQVDLIQAAIHGRFQVELTYNKSGSTPGRRLVDPHVLYVTSTGKLCLHGVQTAGPTDSRRALPDWGIFDLAILRDVEMTDSSFFVDPRLNLTNQKFYVQVICSVQDGGSH